MPDKQITASQLKKAFAKKLNNLMQEKGITQTDISEYLNVTSSTVSDWCNGNKYPRIDKMQRIADLLGVYMSDLTDAEKTEVTLKTETKEAIRILESLPDNLREAALEQLKALSGISDN
jgi:ORF050